MPSRKIQIVQDDKHTGVRSRGWCFTWFNPPRVQLWTALPEGVLYAVWQLEKCPTTGRLHLQGYVRFKNPHGLQGCVDFIDSNAAHWTPARGSDADNKKYCSKEETRATVPLTDAQDPFYDAGCGPFELGNPANPGKRTDLAIAAEAVQRTGDLSEVDPVMIIKFSKGLDRLVELTAAAPKRPSSLKIFCIKGESGIGKSFQVENRFHGELYKPVWGNSGVWFDGYAGQKILLIDEFRGQCRTDLFFKLLDPYDLTLDKKGGTIRAAWDTVFITCNQDPFQWWPDLQSTQPAHFDALCRRVGFLTVEKKKKYMQQRTPFGMWITAEDRPELIKKLDELFPEHPLPAELSLDPVAPVPDEEEEEEALLRPVLMPPSPATTQLNTPDEPTQVDTPAPSLQVPMDVEAKDHKVLLGFRSARTGEPIATKRPKLQPAVIQIDSDSEEEHL